MRKIIIASAAGLLLYGLSNLGRMVAVAAGTDPLLGLIWGAVVAVGLILLILISPSS